MSKSMRGDTRKLEQGCECQDDECNYPATTEICLHADPMGDEWLPICDNHVDEYKDIVDRTIEHDDDGLEDGMMDFEQEDLMSADEQYTLFDEKPLGVFCDALLMGYVLDYNEVPPIAECSKHFNLDGPHRDPRHGEWIGFMACWEDNQVRVAVNLNTMTAMWESKESLNKLKLGAIANVINRIRSWGYPIARAELAGL